METKLHRRARQKASLERRRAAAEKAFVERLEAAKAARAIRPPPKFGPRFDYRPAKILLTRRNTKINRKTGKQIGPAAGETYAVRGFRQVMVERNKYAANYAR